MKIRTIKYMIQEGFSNTYKNLLMTLASVTMVIASLLIFGIFLMIMINLSYNLTQMGKQMEIVVFLDSDISALSAGDIEQKIKNDERVLQYIRVSKDQAFLELKEMIESSSSMEGLTPDFLPESFRIKLKDPGESDVFADGLSKMDGVDEIEFPRKLLESLELILKWVNAGSMFVLALLLIISVSIIANTIKLTVYARRKEIGIMKYIGANDGFIRWPFIIEGMILGLIGAGISFVITCYLYNALESYINDEVISYGVALLKMVPLKNISGQILFVYTIIGMVMGAVGSIISVRKHLNV